mgnify:CR=1 FL=1
MGRLPKIRYGFDEKAALLYMANNPEFIGSMKRGQSMMYWCLLDMLRKSIPKECICCPCFYWERDNGEIVAAKCTLSSAEVDPSKRKEDCPLMALK